jgi:uncharacterized protein
MEIRRHAAPQAFIDRAYPFLLSHEAEHNLILGVSATMREQEVRGQEARLPAPSEPAPYLATVEEGGHVLAAAIRTPPQRLVLSRVEPPIASEALRLIAEDVLDFYGALPGVHGPRDASRAFAEQWQRLTEQPYRLKMAQGIYQLDAVTPVSHVPGQLRRATPAGRDLLVEWLVAFHDEAAGDADRQRIEHTLDARLGDTVTASGAYLWIVDGRPVSTASSTGPTPHGIRIGGVYTPPEQRRRGYASACVAALSQLLLDSGRRFCFLFTDLANPTSNHIYQTIGYRHVCDAGEYIFGAE